MSSRALNLPSAIRVCLFDRDGVLTDTASLHAAAWKELFDTFLRHPGAYDIASLSAAVRVAGAQATIAEH